MDEIIRYEQLASAATTGHWPPHLLAPDEDRLYAVGKALEDTINMIEGGDERAAEIEALREKIGDLEIDFENRIDALRDELEKVEEAEGND